MKLRIRILVVMAISTLLMVIIVYKWNGKYKFSGENELMKVITAKNVLLGRADENRPPDFLFINTANDLELVEVTDEIGMPIGNTDITDRKKLAEFLDLVKNTGSYYRYIFLDIDFDPSYESQGDSALWSAINALPRIVFPARPAADLPKDLDPAKSASAMYTATITESDFTKYPLYAEDCPSMAYKAYSDLNDEHHRSLLGLKFVDNRLMLTSMMPDLTFACQQRYDDDGQSVIYNLGADVLIDPEGVAELIKGKYIFIGAYGDEDIHNTYRGMLDGVVIHANVFADLQRRAHIVPWTVLAVIWLLLALTIYFTIFVRPTIKQGTMFRKASEILQRHKVLKWILSVILAYFTYKVWFSIIIICLYRCTGQIYELWWLALVCTIIYKIDLRKYLKI